MHNDLSCDVLVAGAGAMGLAFADELHARRPNDDIILVDRRAKPGGHWNDAYRFVSLHQPAAFYGVNSLNLGPGGNALATGTEVLSYFERVLDRLVASGRVSYFPQCDWNGADEFTSLVSGRRHRVTVRKKTVNATYMNVQVPSTTPPKYEVADGAALIPPNGLSFLQEAAPEYVVVGAGKTAMDAVLFLLARRVDPYLITWIMPNDAWLLDRDTLTPGRTVGWFVRQLELIADAASLEDVFLDSEKAGSFLRLDSSIWPTKFRCATVNRSELESMRRVNRVIRLGRVRRIEPERLQLEQGDLATKAGALHVDCTADGLAKRQAIPVFNGSTITLQSVFMCQQVFSASLIAYVESRPWSDDKKNALCVPVPHPEFNVDYLTATATTNTNFERWGANFSGWLRKSRLALPYHESFLKLLLNTYKAKRISPKAMATMTRFVDQTHRPTGDPAELEAN